MILGKGDTNYRLYLIYGCIIKSINIYNINNSWKCFLKMVKYAYQTSFLVSKIAKKPLIYIIV